MDSISFYFKRSCSALCSCSAKLVRDLAEPSAITVKSPQTARPARLHFHRFGTRHQWFHHPFQLSHNNNNYRFWLSNVIYYGRPTARIFLPPWILSAPEICFRICRLFCVASAIFSDSKCVGSLRRTSDMFMFRRCPRC